VTAADPPALTFRALLAAAAKRLADAGIPDSASDARILLAEAAGADRMGVLAASLDPVPAAVAETFEDFLTARLARMPVARILGRREFWSLELALSPDTLDPRPDRETLVGVAVAFLKDCPAPAPSVLDLGTGSGALLLATLSERESAWGIGIDRAPGAAAQANANAARLGLSGRAFFACGNWTDALSGRFDVILSNPPYLDGPEMAALAPEVAWFDPAAALYGGPDGLDCYRAILPAVRRLIRPGGLIAVETGWRQAASVQALGAAAGLGPGQVVKDLAGRDRVIAFHA